MCSKAAKMKWALLENHIAKQAHDKYCSDLYKRDLDRLFIMRETKSQELQAEISERDAAILNSSENEVKRIEDQIAWYKSRIANVSEEIHYIQQELVALIDSQDDSPFALLPDLSGINEAESQYIIYKLVALAIGESVKGFQLYERAVKKEGLLNQAKEELEFANRTVAEQEDLIRSIRGAGKKRGNEELSPLQDHRLTSRPQQEGDAERSSDADNLDLVSNPELPVIPGASNGDLDRVVDGSSPQCTY